jgi:hypothetical protein
MDCGTRDGSAKVLLWRKVVTWSVLALIAIVCPRISSSGDTSFDPRKSIRNVSFDLRMPASPRPEPHHSVASQHPLVSTLMRVILRSTISCRIRWAGRIGRRMSWRTINGTLTWSVICLVNSPISSSTTLSRLKTAYHCPLPPLAYRMTPVSCYRHLESSRRGAKRWNMARRGMVWQKGAFMERDYSHGQCFSISPSSILILPIAVTRP